MFSGYASPSGPRYVGSPRRQSVAFSPGASPPARHLPPTGGQPAPRRGSVYERSPSNSPPPFHSKGELVPLFPHSASSPSPSVHGFGRRPSSPGRQGFSPSRYRSNSLISAVHSPSTSSRQSRHGSSTEQAGNSGLSMFDGTEMATTSPRHGFNANATGFWAMALGIVALSSSVALTATLLNRTASAKAAFTDDGSDYKEELSLRFRTQTKLPEDIGVVLRFTPRFGITTGRVGWRKPPFFSVTMRPRSTSSVHEGPTGPSRDDLETVTDTGDDRLTVSPFPKTITTPSKDSTDDYASPLTEPETVPEPPEELTSSVATGVTSDATTYDSTTMSSPSIASESMEPQTSSSESDASSEPTSSSQPTSLKATDSSETDSVSKATTLSVPPMPSEDTASLETSSPEAASSSEPTFSSEPTSSEASASSEDNIASEEATLSEAAGPSEALRSLHASLQASRSSEAATSPVTATSNITAKGGLLVPDDYDDNDFDMPRSALRVL
ncbi:uncharacterized protein LOC144123251 [Amblyomma americanum]